MSEELPYAGELIDKFIEKELVGKYRWMIERDLFDLVAIDVKTHYIHGFEFKSSHDNVYRVFDQLPRYVWLFDYVWLVIGSKQNRPGSLPKWLGVIKYNGESFDRLYEPKNISGVDYREFKDAKGIYLMKRVLPGYNKLGSSTPAWCMFSEFLRKWFINSLFDSEIINYNTFDRSLIYFLSRVEHDLGYALWEPTEEQRSNRIRLEQKLFPTILDKFLKKEAKRDV